jgi:hypothetical protein
MGLFDTEPAGEAVAREVEKHRQEKKIAAEREQAKEEAKKEVQRHEENKQQGMI